MTVQETEGKVAITLTYVSSLTKAGIREILPMHGEKLRILRSISRGFCRPTPAFARCCESLDRDIARLSGIPGMYNPNKAQLTIEWEEYLP